MFTQLDADCSFGRGSGFSLQRVLVQGRDAVFRGDITIMRLGGYFFVLN